ncbi:MAG: bifunctional riboflavin kinase/FAD synthetase [Deltaproteobacteria bacterium]|jgi:riboflavin kinase / FMN adenylyltransferase|nr:bifunctional riboflavin kinase/FAD synthetase [Deltaproteobacteria bacterium]
MIKHFSSKDFSKDTSSPVIVFGNFDGVHLGHQELIQRAKKKGAMLCGTCVVYTFNPHPAKILAPEHPPRLLQTPEQKIAALKTIGVDVCIMEPFTSDFSHMHADDFFKKIIVERLNASAIVVGYDFTFGIHREGTSDTLSNLACSQGIEIDKVEAQFREETLISSTNIRGMISDGDIDMANSLLGRPYSIEGMVISGRGLGGALDAHTANMRTYNELTPRNGVYITETIVEGVEKPYPSVTSIGDNPTFPDSDFAIETHLLDVDMNLLGKNIEIGFLKRVRDQVAFRSQKDLKERIRMDIETSRTFHQAKRDTN